MRINLHLNIGKRLRLRCIEALEQGVEPINPNQELLHYKPRSVEENVNYFTNHSKVIEAYRIFLNLHGGKKERVFNSFFEKYKILFQSMENNNHYMNQISGNDLFNILKNKYTSNEEYKNHYMNQISQNHLLHIFKNKSPNDEEYRNQITGNDLFHIFKNKKINYEENEATRKFEGKESFHDPVKRVEAESVKGIMELYKSGQRFSRHINYKYEKLLKTYNNELKNVKARNVQNPEAISPQKNISYEHALKHYNSKDKVAIKGDFKGLSHREHLRKAKSNQATEENYQQKTIEEQHIKNIVKHEINEWKNSINTENMTFSNSTENSDIRIRDEAVEKVMEKINTAEFTENLYRRFSKEIKSERLRRGFV